MIQATEQSIEPLSGCEKIIDDSMILYGSVGGAQKDFHLPGVPMEGFIASIGIITGKKMGRLKASLDPDGKIPRDPVKAPLYKGFLFCLRPVFVSWSHRVTMKWAGGLEIVFLKPGLFLFQFGMDFFFVSIEEAKMDSQNVEQEHRDEFVPAMTIGEVLDFHRGAAEVLSRYNLHACTTCNINVMETLEQACMAYGIPLDAILTDLNRLLDS